MTTSKSQILFELKTLVNDGVKILSTEIDSQDRSKQRRSAPSEEKAQAVEISYQEWYTLALPIVRQLLPERYAEFQEQYKSEKRKEITYLTYTISDYLLGLRIKRNGQEVVDAHQAFATKFQQQIAILRSATLRIDSILSDIQALLQAELFDNEILVAKELLKKGHLRASGAVAGVTIERHMSHICKERNISLRKTDPTIADLNEALKAANVIDVPNWRFIQRLGDIRNICVHYKGREPEKDEIDELIRGAEKLIKTLS